MTLRWIIFRTVSLMTVLLMTFSAMTLLSDVSLLWSPSSLMTFLFDDLFLWWPSSLMTFLFDDFSLYSSLWWLSSSVTFLYTLLFDYSLLRWLSSLGHIFCTEIKILNSGSHDISQKLRQTKCILFKIWRLKCTIIPKNTIWHMAIWQNWCFDQSYYSKIEK